MQWPVPVYYWTFGYLLGPISSVLVNKYGSRPVMIVGGILSGSGLIAASFCNTVQELYFSVGVIGGELIHFQYINIAGYLVFTYIGLSDILNESPS